MAEVQAEAKQTPTLDPIKSKRSSWELLSKIFVIAAGSTGILSAIGFYVVHSYLYKVTHLFTYKIDAIVYLAAGINLILGVIGRVIATGLTRETLIAVVVTGIAGVVFLFYMQSRPVKKITTTRRYRFLERTLLFVSYGSTVLFIVVASFIYGWYGYEDSPHFLGGGMPSRSILIFKDATHIPHLGLPLQINPTYPAQSQPVELLMELSDGVLVRDPQTQIPVIIKNDLLYGMIDAAPPTPSSTPTASPTP